MIRVKNLGIRATSTLLLLTAFCAAFLGGCSRIPQEYQAFLNLPLPEQHKELRKLPIAKRIEYYLAAMRYNEPPGVALAADIAEEGKQALPVLMKRLREEKDERTQADIMRVFESMHGRYYELRDETEVMSLLRETTEKMVDPSSKERGEEILKYIETDRLPDVEKTLNDINKGFSKP